LPLLVDWQLSVKPSGDKIVSTAKRTVLGWPRSHRRNFPPERPIKVPDFYQAFEQLFGDFSKLSRREQAKYENTVDFVNAMLQ
jgi:hypothetical protein